MTMAVERDPATVEAVLRLDAAAAVDPTLAGAKAAKLAVATGAGLPTLPGFVLTTVASEVRGGRLALVAPLERLVADAWAELSDGGRRPVVVRSSSVAEDAESSSMAGRFRSVLDVVGWEAFTDAVDLVLASATLDAGEPHPMAVLVQPMLDASVGGVLFGADPVSGNPRHLVVEAVEGTPDGLVSGRVTATRYVLDRSGRLLESDAADGVPLGRRQRHGLARLAWRARRVFDGPQDIEWAFDRRGALHLLQSRPITATGHGAHAIGPVLGPGPVAKTFPDQLHPLEVDLWLEPLRRGVVGALRAAGAASEARLAASPVVTTVDGQVAADLELLGVHRDRPSPLARLDPRGPARHLAVAWRVGRLRAALPGLVDDLLGQLDADLAAVPALRALTTPQLVGLVGRARAALAAAHGYEVLAGMLLSDRDVGTVAGHAMRALARGRAEGLDDPETVARYPVVLALTPPRLGGPAPLPAVEPGTEHTRLPAVPRREALRLRTRWLQELLVRAADELGRRLVVRGRLTLPEHVALLRLAELEDVVAGGEPPADLEVRGAPVVVTPLPAAFRLTVEGEVVPRPVAGRDRAGRGAGGGRGSGPVRHADDLGHLTAGDVLVVRTLDPRLATVLPVLGGLVSETGSTLSHLAILAREVGVPAVVGVPDALSRFPAGTVVVVDGTTGQVTPREEVVR